MYDKWCIFLFLVFVCNLIPVAKRVLRKNKICFSAAHFVYRYPWVLFKLHQKIASPSSSEQRKEYEGRIKEIIRVGEKKTMNEEKSFYGR